MTKSNKKRGSVSHVAKSSARQKRFRFNKRQAWKSQCGMPVRLRRILAREKGLCLRCLRLPAVKWKRCQRCLEEHSMRKGR